MHVGGRAWSFSSIPLLAFWPVGNFKVDARRSGDPALFRRFVGAEDPVDRLVTEGVGVRERGSGRVVGSSLGSSSLEVRRGGE